VGAEELSAMKKMVDKLIQEKIVAEVILHFKDFRSNTAGVISSTIVLVLQCSSESE
jgi:hypothetical protein